MYFNVYIEKSCVRRRERKRKNAEFISLPRYCIIDCMALGRHPRGTVDEYAEELVPREILQILLKKQTASGKKTICLKGLSFNLSVALGRNSPVTVTSPVPLTFNRGTCVNVDIAKQILVLEVGTKRSPLIRNICSTRRSNSRQDWG